MFHHILCLSGKTGIEVSDGERRVFKRGDVLLVEDTTCKGHRNRTIDHYCQKQENKK